MLGTRSLLPPLILLVVFVPSHSLAHPKVYEGSGVCTPPTPTGETSQDALNICYVGTCADVPDPLTGGVMHIGGVCFGVGHVQPSSTGTASFSIHDAIFTQQPLSGVVCQDENADGICGEAGELFQLFCSSTVISVRGGWDLGFAIWVVPLSSEFACNVAQIPGVPTRGVVDHS